MFDRPSKDFLYMGLFVKYYHRDCVYNLYSTIHKVIVHYPFVSHISFRLQFYEFINNGVMLLVAESFVCFFF